MIALQAQNQVLLQGDPVFDTGVAPPAPPTPTGFDIDDASTDGNTVMTWNNTGAPTANQIWKSINGGAFAFYATVAGGNGAHSYTDVAAMADKTEWEYKVRAMNGVTPSVSFSSQRGVGKTLYDPGILDYTYTTMVLHYGTFSSEADGVPSIINWPLVRKIFDGLDVAICAFTTFNLNSLVTTGTGGITVAGSSFIPPRALSLPALTTVGTHLDISQISGITSASFPSLATVGSNFFGYDSPNMASVSAPVLTSVGAALNFSNSGGPLSSFSAPMLVSTGDDFEIAITPTLTTLTVTALATVGNNFNVHGNTGIAALSFPALASIANDAQINDCTSAVTINIGALANIGGTTFLQGNNALLVLSCPALVTAAFGINFYGCSSLTSASFPVWANTSAGIDGHNCAVLNTFSIGGAVQIQSDMIMGTCPALATVSIPNVTFADNGGDIDFTGDAIVAGNAGAGTGINGILRRGVVSATTGSSYGLDGGTNSSPTGGMANADYVALTGLGNAVNIN